MNYGPLSAAAEPFLSSTTPISLPYPSWTLLSSSISGSVYLVLGWHCRPHGLQVSLLMPTLLPYVGSVVQSSLFFSKLKTPLFPLRDLCLFHRGPFFRRPALFFRNWPGLLIHFPSFFPRPAPEPCDQRDRPPV